jgi:hypothetical protein
MGSLALVASHTVNGVSKLHSELLKERVFKVRTVNIFPAIDGVFHSLCSMEFNVFGTDVVRISMIYFLTSSKTRQMVLLRSTPLCLSNFSLNLQKLYTTPMIENPEPSNIVWPQYFIYMAYKDVVQGQVNVPSLDTDQNSIC